MQVSIETTSGLERRLTVSVPAETVDQEVAKRLQQATKTVNINGFRKGKVPLKVVKQRYGAGVRQEVIGDTINKSFYEAVQKESLKPAGQPTIDAKQLDEGKDIEFVATFEVYPEVTIKDLDTVEVTRYSADVTDADVEEMIKNLQDQQATWADSKGKAANGDKLDIDYKGQKDGEAFDGGTAEGQSLVLGSNSMIPGFESGLVGLKAGEETTLELTFPEDYHAEELKGAAVTFEVKVNGVQKKKKPKIDEEFYAKFGITEGGEEKFLEEVKANMLRERDRAIKNKLKEQALAGLLDKNPVDVPSSLVQAEIEALRNQTVQQYGGAVKGMDLKAILPDDMFKEQAENRATLGLLISEVVTAEKIAADKDKVRALIDEVAATYEDPQEVVNYYYSNEQLLNSVEAAALEEQVVEFLIEKAQVKEETVSYKELVAPAKA